MSKTQTIALKVDIDTHDSDAWCVNAQGNAAAVLRANMVEVYKGPDFTRRAFLVYVDDKSDLAPFKDGWLAYGETGATYIDTHGAFQHLQTIAPVHGVRDEIILGNNGFAIFANRRFWAFSHTHLVHDAMALGAKRFLMTDSKEQVYLVSDDDKRLLDVSGTHLHACTLFFAVERPGNDVSILDYDLRTLTKTPWQLNSDERIQRVAAIEKKRREGVVITNKRAIVFKIYKGEATPFAICESDDITNVYHWQGFIITENNKSYHVWLEEPVSGLHVLTFTKDPGYATIALQARNLLRRRGRGK
ncbi:MAG: hypothetical protein D6750_10330 [Bacteroidetes bacterium]|nr:MAG: hypothetical protein D6750_10330 [Bacteroidota bacterium]